MTQIQDRTQDLAKGNWARLVNHTERCGSKITRGRLLELQRRIESDLSQLSVMKTSAKAPFDKEKYLRSVDFMIGQLNQAYDHYQA